jgi:hypothetical protein
VPASMAISFNSLRVLSLRRAMMLRGNEHCSKLLLNIV